MYFSIGSSRSKSWARHNFARGITLGPGPPKQTIAFWPNAFEYLLHIVKSGPGYVFQDTNKHGCGIYYKFNKQLSNSPLHPRTFLMAHPNASRAISLPPIILVEDIEFPVSGIRSSLTMPSPTPISRVLYSAPAPHSYSDIDNCDRDLSNLPSLSVSGSRKRKRAPRRPTAVDSRRLRIRIPGRSIEQAATQSKTLVKIRIPAQKAANDQLRPSSRINIAFPPSATSPSASQDLDDLPQKLKITIPPITKPLLLVDGPQIPATPASQGFPMSFKIKIPPLNLLPHCDQNTLPDVSHPNDTVDTMPSPARPRRIAPLPKRYRQGV
jgi:hypothetical protein